MPESKEKLKDHLIKVKEESEKAGLKLSIQKTESLASSPITSSNRWGNKGNRARFYFLGLQNHQPWLMTTAMKLKKPLLLGRKARRNLDFILKNKRHYFSNKCPSSESWDFSVVMYGCKSWIIKKSEGEGEVAQSCPTLCDPMDCNLLGFSVHGILQARILEWIAISFSKGSSRPRDRT